MTTLEQLKAIVGLSERFGRKIATAQEAREIMKIGVWYDSVEETLKHLGMPPNRGDDDRGFMVWETDGKKAVEHSMSDSHPMAYCMVPPSAGPDAAKAPDPGTKPPDAGTAKAISKGK